MFKIIFFPTILVIVLISCSNLKSDNHKEDAKALIHTIKKRYKGVKTIGNPVPIPEFDPAGQRIIHSSINEDLIYNKNESEIDKIWYTESGEKWYRELYTYNEDGALSSRKEYNYNYSEGTSERLKDSVIMYLFDTRGNLIEKYRLNEDSTKSLLSTTINSYNEEGKLIEAITNNADNTLNKRKVIVYNDDKKKTTNFDKNGNIQLESKVTFSKHLKPILDSIILPGVDTILLESKYDAKGNQIEESIKSGQGFVKSTYKYDIKGNVVHSIKYDIDENIVFKANYKYEFDSNNNWTKRITIVNDSTTHTTERIIKYF